MNLTDTKPTTSVEDSAPNMAGAEMPDAELQTRSSWMKEIHTPEAEYNANVPLDAIERDPANRMPGEADVAAAERVMVKLPKGMVSDQGGFGMRDVDLMRKMDVMELTRVAVAVLLEKELDNANKNAWGLPKNIEALMNSETAPANLGVGDLVEWNDGQKQGVIITTAEYEKAMGFKWGKDWSTTSTPVRLTKKESLDLPYNGIHTDALRLVKAAAPAELVKITPCPAALKKFAKGNKQL